MRAILSSAVGLGLFLMATAPLAGHHSFAAEFDINKKISVQGSITSMLWVNPHGWLHIDVKEADGTVANWAIEFGGPQMLYRRGWKQSDLPVGEVVTVEGFQAKDGSHMMSAESVKLPNGRALFAGAPGSPGAPVQ